MKWLKSKTAGNYMAEKTNSKKLTGGRI